MKKMHIILTAAAALVAASAPAQVELTTDWKISVATTGAPAWFAPDNLTRGADKIPGGNLLIASRLAGNVVHQINPTTGADLAAPLPNTNYSTTTGEQTFIINKVGVAADGIIYVSNLALAANTNIFRVYRHADAVSASTIAFAGPPADTVRSGDDMSVIGSGNGTKILVGNSGFPNVSKFTTADGGLTFTRTIVTPTAIAVGGTPHLEWDPSATSYWFRNTGGTTGGNYDDATNAAGGVYAGPRPSTGLYAAFTVGTLAGVPSYALGSGNVGAGNTVIQGEVYAQSDFLTTAITYFTNDIRPSDNTPVLIGTNANANGAGDVIIEGNSIYWLITNNVIVKTSLPANVRDWNLY